MKKIAVLLLSTCSIAQAGTMGAIATQHTYMPYITAEAAYTGATVGNVVVNNFQYSNSFQRWGGRLGAGIAYPSFINNLNFTAEIGGGYYGSFRATGQTVGGVLADHYNATIDGYDVLVGALYKTTTYPIDFFGQLGFMIQNVRNSGTTNLALATPGSGSSGVISAGINNTEVFPELKVGGIYNFNEHWGFSLAYMAVFGSRQYMNNNQSLSGLTSVSFVNANGQNPFLNSVMFGLHYNLV